MLCHTVPAGTCNACWSTMLYTILLPTHTPRQKFHTLSVHHTPGTHYYGDQSPTEASLCLQVWDLQKSSEQMHWWPRLSCIDTFRLLMLKRLRASKGVPDMPGHACRRHASPGMLQRNMTHGGCLPFMPAALADWLLCMLPSTYICICNAACPHAMWQRTLAHSIEEEGTHLAASPT